MTMSINIFKPKVRGYTQVVLATKDRKSSKDRKRKQVLDIS